MLKNEIEFFFKKKDLKKRSELIRQIRDMGHAMEKTQ